jgi:hypothetical protein
LQYSMVSIISVCTASFLGLSVKQISIFHL